MKPYVKIYMEYFDYVIDSFIPCEACGRRSESIHHIDNKGMGGSKTKDYIENLMALCMECHTKAHNEKFSKEFLYEHHKLFMK